MYPRLTLAVSVSTIPEPVEFKMFPPEPLLLLPPSPFTVKLPDVLFSTIPFVALVEETLRSETVPLRFESDTAVPVVVTTDTSLTVTPLIAAAGSFNPVLVVELILNPRTVELEFNVTVLVIFVMVPFPLLIDGSDALPEGGVSPVIVARLAVAS